MTRQAASQPEAHVSSVRSEGKGEDQLSESQREQPNRDALTRIAVLCPVRLVCDVLADAFAREPSLLVRGRGTTVESLRRVFEQDRSVMLVYDGSTTALIQTLRASIAALEAERVVVFGLCEAPGDLKQCAEQQVGGLVGREASLHELVTAIHRVAADGHYTAPSLTATLMQLLANSGPTNAQVLTARELDVAKLLARGCPGTSICATLGLRPGTLKSHVRSIYRKFGVHHREELAGRFDRASLGSCDDRKTVHLHSEP